ncbi:MAG: hypothetical protein ACE5K7_05290, partial [Phycisphaerae bacterium]
MSVFSPYLASPAHPDTRSLATVLEWPGLAGKKDQTLVEALWRWLIDRRIGTYHFLDPIEEPGEPLTGDPVKDPIRLLNSYGYMLCGSHAMLTASVLRQTGYQARVTGLTGHNVAEVFYDGAWHCIDVDMHALHYRREGDRLVIASCAELCANPELVARPIKPTEPYYLPDRDPADVARNQYRPGFCRYWPAYWYQLHSLEFALRPGESLTYYHGPQGRFHYPPALVRHLKRWHPSGWDGPRERFEPARTYANACLCYRPKVPHDLSGPGVDCVGLEPSGSALRATTAENELTIRLISPYVIVGRTPDLARPERKCDGATVRLASSARPTVRLRVPFSQREQELPLASEGGFWQADFTEAVDGSYEYELSIRLPVGAELSDLELTTWLQVAPCALPHLSAGTTEMTLRLGDQFGLASLPRIVDLVRSARRDSSLVVRGRLQDDPRLKLVGDDGVELAAPLIGPAHARLAWIKLWAAVQSDQQPVDPSRSVRLEIAVDRGGPWSVLSEQPVQADHQRYHFSVEAVHRFDSPRQQCWARLVSPN